MDEKLEFFNKWVEAAEKMKEAMKNGEITLADQFLQEMEDAYERYKEAANFEDSTRDASFATLNMALENAIPTLFVKNKNAVKDCIMNIRIFTMVGML